MYYGLYKGIRNSAWKCLEDFKIDSLPVDVLKITRAAGIRVIKNSAVIDNSAVKIILIVSINPPKRFFLVFERLR